MMFTFSFFLQEGENVQSEAVSIFGKLLHQGLACQRKSWPLLFYSVFQKRSTSEPQHNLNSTSRQRTNSRKLRISSPPLAPPAQWKPDQFCLNINRKPQLEAPSQKQAELKNTLFMDFYLSCLSVHMDVNSGTMRQRHRLEIEKKKQQLLGQGFICFLSFR